MSTGERQITESGREAVRLRGLFGGETEERASLWVRKIESEAHERSAGAAPIDCECKHPWRWHAAQGCYEKGCSCREGRSAGASPIDAEEWDRLGGYPPPPAPGEDLIVSGDPIILSEGTDR